MFKEAVEAVDPYELVKNRLSAAGPAFMKESGGRLIVAAFGKAACPMAKAARDCLGDVISSGVAITKYGHAEEKPEGIEVYEAGHPVPDENGLKATEGAIKLVSGAGEGDTVLCLISGGGSALLVSPIKGITLNDKQRITDGLLKSGADINSLNAVRKHISKVKGGRLAELAFPAKVVSLILSDVLGDRLDVIASGPTAPDTTSYADALSVLSEFGLMDKAPAPVIDVLQRGLKGEIPDTPKKGSPVFRLTENIIIGNNAKALDAAKAKASAMGLDAETVSTGISGEARDAGRALAKRAVQIKRSRKNGLPVCLLSGGETTVTVRGGGMGGRNTELALAFAMEVRGMEGITLLSAGTDGADGPTDAAGAFADGQTAQRALALGIEAGEHLERNDSYGFFKRAGGLFVTGPTRTNVMDVQMVIIQ